jgi:hypothetical protein
MLHGWKAGRPGSQGRRGNATLIALVAVMVLGGMSMGILALTSASQREMRGATESLRAQFAAEAGVANAFQELALATSDEAQAVQGQEGVQLDAGQLGCAGAPRSMEQSSYWSTVVDGGGGLFTITSTGESGSVRRSVEVVVQQAGDVLFDHALFAGNSSGDPNYVMKFGGTGGQADEVEGDVYSGGDVEINGDATVDGSVRASGTILPGGGTEGVSQPVPDFAAMDYASTADYDVAALFAAGASSHSNGAGGTALQMPSTSPVHIFRENPSDRVSDTSGTVKDDYFLEDPYETVRVDAGMDGSDAYQVSLSPGGENKVYYIDGNLWIHNKKTYSFQLASLAGGDGTRITIVVRGNIYISDNLFYTDPEQDGVVLIALKDEAVEDSGNIYFGDPTFGTLEHMEAFMYAENNFYDNNLDAAGSADVTVVGNMTAGNEVLINRDYGDQHSKLTVRFDDRISTGVLEMPGLPGQDQGVGALQIVSWREVAAD